MITRPSDGFVWKGMRGETMKMVRVWGDKRR